MGIQFDEAAYLTEPAHEIYSRYVLTAADTPTAARLQADGWTVLYESDRGRAVRTWHNVGAGHARPAAFPQASVL